MSKNTSPQTRSSSGPRSSARGRGRTKAASPSAARVASTVGKEAKARRDPGPVTWGSRIRRMFFVVAVPNLVAFLSLVVIALATVLLTSSPTAWLPTAIAESWMVTNLAPVEAGGIVISALPTLPALILGWLVSSSVHRAVKDKVSINDLLVLLAWIIVVPLILVGIAWFMLWDASQVYDVTPPSLGPTIARTVALHLTALVIGMGSRLWRALARRYKVPRAVVDGVQLAITTLLVVLAVAAVILVLMILFNWDNQGVLMHSYPQIAGLGIFALIGLSVLYVPSALVAAASILLGSEFHIGDASVSLFSVHLIPLPPLPLLGAIPASVSPWAIGLLILPALAIAYVGIKAKPNFVQAAVAGVAAGVLTLVFGYFISGELGYYDTVGTMLLMSAGLALVWVGGIHLAIAAGFYINARRNAPAVAASADPVGDEPAEGSTEQSEEEAENDSSSDESVSGEPVADEEVAEEATSESNADTENVTENPAEEAETSGEDAGSTADAGATADAETNPEAEAMNVEEGSQAVDEAAGNGEDSKEAEVDTDHRIAEAELSADLMDNLEDGAFPESALGEDDIDERLPDANSGEPGIDGEVVDAEIVEDEVNGEGAPQEDSEEVTGDDDGWDSQEPSSDSKKE